MQGECPDCFAKFERVGRLAACASCQFLESCRYCAENDDRKVNRRLGHVSYDRYSYSQSVSTPAPEPEYDDAADSREDDAEVRRVMEFLMDIDNYSAELLSEVLHGNANTASDLARKFGVSRQAIHRKIVDCCTAHPELRKLFITRLYRCRRIMQNSKRMAERVTQKQNPNQMEFNF